MKISVVVVTYNSARDIEGCLDSVRDQAGQRAGETVVVDNGSSDGTPELIRERYPNVQLLVNDYNAGASAARNQGIRASHGDWVLTLDPDAQLKKDFLDSFTRFMERYRNGGTRAGVVAAKILFFDKRTVYSMGHVLTFLRRFYDVGMGLPDQGQFDRGIAVFGACSAAAFYKRRMLEDILGPAGYFDERFFYMAEDVDLAWRARRGSWRVLSCPEAVAYHRGGGSGTAAAVKDFYSIRNRFFMIFKNDRLLYLALVFAPLLSYEVLRIAALAIQGRAGVWFSAWCSFMKGVEMKKVLLVVFFVFCAPVYAGAQMKEYKTEEDEAKAYDVTRTNKTVDGLHFTVEEDRPIVKVAGVYRPIDFDSYVALKFKKLQDQMQETEGRLQAKIDTLSEKLELLTQKVEELKARGAEDAREKQGPSPKE